MRLLSGFKKTLRILHMAENASLLLLFVTLVGIVFAQVFTRNVLGSAIVWADLAVRTLVLWVTLFGAMVATRQHNHIRIDLLPNLLTDRKRDILRCVYLTVASGVAFTVTFYSFQVIRMEWSYPAMAFANVPTWLAQAVIPLGFGVIGLRFLGQGLVALHCALTETTP